MAEEFGEICDFIPKGFCMPEDYIKFVAEHSKRQEKDCPEAKNVVAASELCTFEDPNAVAAILTSTSPPGDKKGSKAASSTLGNKARYPIWIIKPLGKSQGKGIILTKDIGVVASSHRCVVQEYIARPHLIGGKQKHNKVITNTIPKPIFLQDLNGTSAFTSASRPLILSSSTCTEKDCADLPRKNSTWPIFKRATLT